MAHTIGAKVIAEGVEDEKILNLALKLGCEFAQDFILRQLTMKT